MLAVTRILTIDDYLILGVCVLFIVWLYRWAGIIRPRR